MHNRYTQEDQVESIIVMINFGILPGLKTTALVWEDYSALFGTVWLPLETTIDNLNPH